MAAPNTADGRSLLAAEVTEPEFGPWRIELQADHDQALQGRITVNLDGAEWSGTVIRSTVDAGRVTALVVAGAGALAADDQASVTVPAKSYRGSSLGLVLADILSATGEALESGSVGALSGFQVPTWSRPAGPAKRSMEAAMAKAGVSWRLGRDGLVWIGEDDWPEATGSPILSEDNSAQGFFLLRDGIGVRPGTTYRGERIRQAVHRLEGAATVTEAWTQAPSGVFDRQREMARREVDAAQLWPAEVVSQRADGTLELLPDDERVRGTGIDGVVITPGLPGVQLTVPTGARCLIAFAGGDLSRPRVVAWDTDTVLTLIRIGGSGADFVALAAKVLTELGNIKTWADVHTHPTGVGPSGAPAIPMTQPQSVAATKLKTV